MTLRYRSFGLGGSIAEIVVGLFLLPTAFDDEPYPLWFQSAIVLVAVALCVAGVIGVALAAKDRHARAGRSRTRRQAALCRDPDGR